ncbi:MAG TPA: transcription-repair coupling factor [Fimbriimonadaceae bacterium]|nr:transcription-repair coupling factor [Fimbriimonadaceae bacterium]
MRVAAWSRELASLPGLAEAFQGLESSSCVWRAVPLEARPLLLAALYHRAEGAPFKALVVAPTYEKALQWQARLTLCGVPDGAIRQLPSGIASLFEDASPETHALSDRIGALRFLVGEEPGIVIGSPQAILERTLPREALEGAFFDVGVGIDLDLGQALRALERLGYEAAEPVRAPGQYSQRGGILDIFATGRTLPVRIELFGDTVESLREFDPSSQRSIGPVGSLSLAPSRETLFPTVDSDSPGLETFAEMLGREAAREAQGLSEEAAERLQQHIAADARSLDRRVFFDRLDLYRPLMHPDSNCAIDLLGETAWIVLDEPFELEAIAARAEEELGEALSARAERGEILRSTAHDFMLPPEHLAGHRRVLALCGIADPPAWVETAATFDLNGASLEPYRGRPETLTQTLTNWLAAGFHVLVGTDQPTRARAVLSQVDLHPADLETPHFDPGFYIAAGNLAGGFALPELKIALLTDQELFGVGRLKLPQKRFNEGAPIATVLDLKPGDYVVHINFGIGIFRGLTTRTVDGVEKEYLFIQYQAPDKLFVPTDQLDRIQKYLNPSEVEPKLNRLTGGEWKRTVGKAREEAREFARGLIKLYAQRKKVQRKPYGGDTPWQAEMEATFPWVETPAQLQAIVETKQDLNLEWPMDRLICGDVGFGKTEVAIRAAFKVAQENRQVAVLCPTTILSEQHFRNFVERLAPFPIRLEILNRFRSAGERKDVLDAVKAGEVDILIGTHALLSAEVDFHDLGLVIIDEEQKFGVKQKEALKQLRVSVDVLAMSATPIPRTLSMALMDIRQMSLINDPPPGRLPVRTFVRAFSQEVVREAALREAARGGQVYYVYNRVQGIQHVAQRLRKLLPNLRIGVGHGQMTEQELEPVMVAFIKGEIDLLVSTTIVENGLDIPNANTLIVENADMFGLSQLYQLRGRVGRSDRQAYAYLLYQTNKELGENALHRLQALQEFSSLGSGYSLAFRDLQIRGAGDLLGAKQHGAMATVGFELYTQLINEEVAVLKAFADSDGKKKAPDADPLEGLVPLPTVDLPVSALIPNTYIGDSAQRLFYYKEIMSCRTLDELAERAKEIEDRYGRKPAEVEAAFAVMRLRMRSDGLEIEKVDGKGGRLSVVFREDAELSPRMFSLLTKLNRECYFSRTHFIWPFSGSALTACDAMLTAIESVLAAIEAQRAQLEAASS